LRSVAEVRRGVGWMSLKGALYGGEVQEGMLFSQAVVMSVLRLRPLLFVLYCQLLLGWVGLGWVGLSLQGSWWAGVKLRLGHC
jgi:hypothetical protein